MMRALDLFSAAAGGWSLGLHRAGFLTVAACEIVEWRRILYAENNPHVRLYEDVRTLSAARLVSDLGFLPDIIVGSPPCQDISSANAKGRGIEGERSGLYLEAVDTDRDGEPTGPVINPEMGGRACAGGNVAEPWADWNGGFARHLRLDDGLSAWVADTRIALSSRKGTSAASLIVEAFGDAVLPQIPKAIDRAILRTEAALDAVLARDPQHNPGDRQ